MSGISERLKLLRQKLNLTQEGLARKLMISREYLSRMENGHEPSARLEKAITDAELIAHSENNDHPTSDEKSHSDNEVDTQIQQARALFEQLLAAANGSPQRLGWIIEQIHQHLRPPAHWKIAEPEASDSYAKPAKSDKKIPIEARLQLDQIKRTAQQSAFGKALPTAPAVQPQSPHKGAAQA